MRKTFIAIGLLAICWALGIYFVLSSEYALLAHPKGIMAQRELDVIVRNIILMLIVVVPTFIVLFITAWRYRSANAKAKYDPEHSHGAFGELILWIIPAIVIAVMMVVTWYDAHELDPHRPLESDAKPLTIQVLAIDWKWLFIYPEQGIATLNFVQFPEHTPIHFELAADDSPMNSFWIPQLSGQIYAMTGMVTQLHIMADEPGEYAGRAAEINGEGLADMTFVAKATSLAEFEDWVRLVKQSPQHLTDETYKIVAARSMNNPIALYSTVEKGLFDNIVMKYHMPGK